MNCNNCGTVNSSDSKFCIKCGNPLATPVVNNGQAINPTPVNQEPIINQAVVEQSMPQQTYTEQPALEPQVQTYVEPTIVSKPMVSNAPLNYLMYIIAVLLKPFNCFKEEESKLTNTKTSLILSIVVAGSMMVIDLVKAMISAVFVKSFDLSTLEYKTSFDISGLENLDYLQLIGKNLLIYAGVIVAIALIYYLASLVFKKQTSFIKLLSITATSLIPYVVLGMVAAPLLSKIWSDLYLIIMIISIVYSLLIFINLINAEVDFADGDMRIYYNGICMAVLLIAAYYLIVNMITSTITSDFGSMLNMFG